jgi:hypothetical protein
MPEMPRLFDITQFPTVPGEIRLDTYRPTETPEQIEIRQRRREDVIALGFYSNLESTEVVAVPEPSPAEQDPRSSSSTS